MIEAREVLSALIDGEAVDADAVAAALEEPANRAALADFIRLRASVQRDDEMPATWRPEPVSPVSPKRHDTARMWLRVAAALALLTAGVLGGAWFQVVARQERPPEPTRVVRLQLVESR